MFFFYIIEVKWVLITMVVLLTILDVVKLYFNKKKSSKANQEDITVK